MTAYATAKFFGSGGRLTFAFLCIGILGGLASTHGTRILTDQVDAGKHVFNTWLAPKAASADGIVGAKKTWLGTTIFRIERAVNNRIEAAVRCVAPLEPAKAPGSRFECDLPFTLLMCAGEKILRNTEPACRIAWAIIWVWPRSAADSTRIFAEVGRVDDPFARALTPMQRLAVAYYIAEKRLEGDTFNVNRALKLLSAGILVAGDFGNGGMKLQGEGWGSPESWGTWTISKRASLLPIPIHEHARNKDLIFQVDVIPFIPRPGRNQVVHVFANGTKVASWLFTEANPQRVATALITRQAVGDLENLSLYFDVPNAASPFTSGISNDVRTLGVGFKKIIIKEIEFTPAAEERLDLSMRSNASSASYVTAGWLPPTEAGIWAVDETASLIVPVSIDANSKAILEIDTYVQNEQDNSRPSIEVAVNGDVVGKLKNGDTSNTFAIPNSGLSSDDRLLIEFRHALEARSGSKPSGSLPLLLKNVSIRSTPPG